MPTYLLSSDVKRVNAKCYLLLHVEAGILLLSRGNPLYTHVLLCEYSPYSIASTDSFLFQVANGFQGCIVYYLPRLGTY